MSTYIKTGYWIKTLNRLNGYLDLERLIKKIITDESGSLKPTPLDFIATNNQTEFIIEEEPESLLLVTFGRNVAIESIDFTYLNGLLTFFDPLLVGTRVKVIF